MTPDIPTRGEIAERLTLEAANDGEALISVARAVFCLMVLTRFLVVHDSSTPVDAHLLEVPLLVVASVASAWAFRQARRGLFRTRGLIVMSVADAMVCFASLLSSVLWPSVLYPGLLRTPDVAVFLPIIFVSVLRFTLAATVASVCANLLAATALVAVDLSRNPARLSYGASEVALLVIFMATVGAVAIAATRGACKLVERTGDEASKVSRARHHLDAILREHHDVRSLLSTARINLQLARKLPNLAAERIQAVEQAIVELSDFVEGVKVQACPRRSKFEPPCRLNFEPGWKPTRMRVGCG